MHSLPKKKIKGMFNISPPLPFWWQISHPEIWLSDDFRLISAMVTSQAAPLARQSTEPNVYMIHIRIIVGRASTSKILTI